MSSSKMTQIYAGIGLVAVLGGVWWMQQKSDKSITNTTYTEGKKVAPPAIKVVPEEIDKLTIKSKDKQEFTLEKKGTDWSMAAPVAGAKINKSTVDDILNGLKGLAFKDAIAKGKDQYVAYDLEDNKAIHVVASKGGAAVVDLWIGAQKSRGLMARLGADEQIWSITGLSAWSFDKAPRDVRDKKVWDLMRDNVASIEVRDAKGSFVFQRVAATAPAGDAGTDAPAPTALPDGATPMTWAGSLDGKPLANLDAAKVDDLVNAFSLGSVLNAEDFGDGKSDDETGLASADATAITFHAKDGATSRIVLGKASSGVKRYARKDGDALVFVLGDGPSGWAEMTAEKVTKPAPAATAGDAGVDAAAPAPKK